MLAGATNRNLICILQKCSPPDLPRNRVNSGYYHDQINGVQSPRPARTERRVVIASQRRSNPPSYPIDCHAPQWVLAMTYQLTRFKAYLCFWYAIIFITIPGLFIREIVLTDRNYLYKITLFSLFKHGFLIDEYRNP